MCVNDGVPVFSQTLIYRIRVLIGIGSAVWFGRLRGRGVVVRVHVGGSIDGLVVRLERRVCPVCLCVPAPPGVFSPGSPDCEVLFRASRERPLRVQLTTLRLDSRLTVPLCWPG